jgi:pimeloyl-ACP methyl ester carboxylesterase
MFVLHGLLGSKVNWKGICGNKKILTRRDCYLLEMRNHATSDHHKEHSYQVMSEDIIRFADLNKIEKFTVLGHSMGGRLAMTLACRFPDRLEGAISVDAAPVD